MNQDLLMLLWESTDALHRRFDKFPPNPDETMMVFEEECEEFHAEVQFAEDAKIFSGLQTCHEGIDVIVTILATLSALGISREQFRDAAFKVIAKNGAKTHETHYIREDGKIARRVKA